MSSLTLSAHRRLSVEIHVEIVRPAHLQLESMSREQKRNSVVSPRIQYGHTVLQILEATLGRPTTPRISRTILDFAKRCSLVHGCPIVLHLTSTHIWNDQLSYLIVDYLAVNRKNDFATSFTVEAVHSHVVLIFTEQRDTLSNDIRWHQVMLIRHTIQMAENRARRFGVEYTGQSTHVFWSDLNRNAHAPIQVNHSRRGQISGNAQNTAAKPTTFVKAGAQTIHLSSSERERSCG